MKVNRLFYLSGLMTFALKENVGTPIRSKIEIPSKLTPAPIAYQIKSFQ